MIVIRIALTQVIRPLVSVSDKKNLKKFQITGGEFLRNSIAFVVTRIILVPFSSVTFPLSRAVVTSLLGDESAFRRNLNLSWECVTPSSLLTLAASAGVQVWKKNIALWRFSMRRLRRRRVEAASFQCHDPGCECKAKSCCCSVYESGNMRTWTCMQRIIVGINPLSDLEQEESASSKKWRTSNIWPLVFPDFSSAVLKAQRLHRKQHCMCRTQSQSKQVKQTPMGNTLIKGSMTIMINSCALRTFGSFL